MILNEPVLSFSIRFVKQLNRWFLYRHPHLPRLKNPAIYTPEILVELGRMSPGSATVINSCAGWWTAGRSIYWPFFGGGYQTTYIYIYISYGKLIYVLLIICIPIDIRLISPRNYWIYPAYFNSKPWSSPYHSIPIVSPSSINQL